MLVAALCVLWGVGATTLMLWQTRDYPGVVSFKPGQGSWEIIEIFSHRPTGAVLAGLALLLLMLAGLLEIAARWLDPQGRARDALYWPLASWRMPVAIIAAIAASWAETRMPWGEWLIWAGLLAWMALPWFAWTPATLEGAGPGLRRPRWPGWVPVLAAFGLFAWQGVTGLAFDLFESRNAWVNAAWLSVDSMLSFGLLLGVAALWLRGTWPQRGPVSAFFGRGTWHEYAWLILAFAWLAGVLVLPLLALVAHGIFVLPQLEEVAREMHQPMPPVLQWQWDIGRAFSGSGSFYASLLFTGWFALSLGRWLWLRRVEAD